MLSVEQWSCMERYSFCNTNGGIYTTFPGTDMLWIPWDPKRRPLQCLSKSQSSGRVTWQLPREVPELCETSWHAAGLEDFTAKGAQEVRPQEEPVDLGTTPFEAREELPGPRKHLPKSSPSTRPVLEEQRGKMRWPWYHSMDAEKHLASMPWNLETETHTDEALHLL